MVPGRSGSGGSRGEAAAASTEKTTLCDLELNPLNCGDAEVRAAESQLLQPNKLIKTPPLVARYHGYQQPIPWVSKTNTLATRARLPAAHGKLEAAGVGHGGGRLNNKCVGGAVGGQRWRLLVLLLR